MKEKKHTRLIGLAVGAAMTAQILSAGITAGAWSDNLFDKYKDKGVYAYCSSEGDVENGLLQFDGSASITPNYNGMPNCRLVDVDDEEAAAELFGDSAGDITAAAKSAGLQYAANNVDGGVMHKAAASSDGETKDAWFTTRYYRSTAGAQQGFIYFRLTNDAITVNDNDVYLLIEYLDRGNVDLIVQYVTKVYASSAGDWWRASANSAVSIVNIPRNNSGRW